jgi:hypothetical protein
MLDLVDVVVAETGHLSSSIILDQRHVSYLVGFLQVDFQENLWDFYCLDMFVFRRAICAIWSPVNLCMLREYTVCFPLLLSGSVIVKEVPYVCKFIPSS